MNRKFLSIAFLVLTLLLSVSTVFAQAGQSTNTGGSGMTTDVGGKGMTTDTSFTVGNPLKCGSSGNQCTIFKLLETIIQNIILPVGGVIAVLAFIYSGFLYVMARGNPTKIATANQALLYSAIGTVLLLGSWVIANILQNTITSLGSGL